MADGFDTRAIHAGQVEEACTGTVAFPIYQTSTYGQTTLGEDPPYCYSRSGNPTRQALEHNLAALEDANHGLAFASGMSAINNVLNLLQSGDHVVACSDLYGGAYRLFTKLYSKFGVAFSFVDATEVAAISRALRPETRMLWLETPSNPLLKITDIEACSGIAQKSGLWTVVDNTFATPYLQRPLKLGADIVVHSTTKYLGGHSDVLGGVVLTNLTELHERLQFFQNTVGAVPGPQDCFLVLRGVKTLSLRMDRHCESAARVAKFLAGHAAVQRTIYPGLRDHPQYLLAERQLAGFGGIVSFELPGGLPAVRQLVENCALWTLAESLGGPKSLVCHPASMTHASVEPQVRHDNGISDGLVRLSVGLENAEDLISDLDQALRAVEKHSQSPAKEEAAT